MQELTIKQKLTNYYYFVIFNSILACVIGVGYWFRTIYNIYLPIPEVTNVLDILYIITTHFSIITLSIFIISIFILPTIYFETKNYRLSQCLLFGLVLAILVCDIRMFQCYSEHVFFHISIKDTIEDIISKLDSGEVTIGYVVTKAIACSLIVAIMLLIYKINKWLSKTNWIVNNSIATQFTLVLIICCIISILIHHTASDQEQQKLLAYTQHFRKFNIIPEIENMSKIIKTGKLQYPLKSLQTIQATNPPNILIIAMDAWRADCFNEQDSPNLWLFAQNGKIFKNHFSGGNHTASGLFSLFYGIPAVYRNRFKKQHTTALLLSRLEQLDYQINYFVDYNNIEMLQHYVGIRNINMQDKNISRTYQRDQESSQSWLNWCHNLDKAKPWFAFVFYHSLHDLDFPESYSIIAKPAIDHCGYKKFVDQYGKANFIASYKTSVHYIDSLADGILQQLKDNNDLENTIVIVTADHGCEWDDNNQGQWGYWSNFTNCQVKVPLAIILPKKFQSQLISQQNNLTTHYDIVPTIMHNFLGVTNNIADYSIGNDLLNNNQTQKWYLACSSAQYGSCSSAIIANDKVLKIFPSGIVNYLDNFNRLMLNKTINTKYLNKALEYMTRFIKK